MEHFSHEKHRLKIIENWEMITGTVDDGDTKQGESVVCSGCRQPIGSAAAYGCIECNYFLHKRCAQLEPSVNHQLHPPHSLILTVSDMFWYCDLCGNRWPKGAFSYCCSLCDFDGCIKCVIDDIVAQSALKEKAVVKFEHEGHPQHTLSLQTRPGVVFCDACKIEDRDFFYQCNDCDFWIHETCATLAHTIDLPHHHHHPLILAYSLPDNFYNFLYFCEFCNKYIQKVGHWIYHCANCRYFAHIKCALNADKLSTLSADASTSKDEDLAENIAIMHFPMLDDSLDLLRLYFKKMSCSQSFDDDDDGPTEINHWSHGHPLILNVKALGNNFLPNINESNDDPIVVCYGCVRPLSFPFYSCKDGCDFYLHKYCANELPRALQHKFHLDHSLQLVDFRDDPHSWFYKCSVCFNWGNTFVYKCTTCKFYLDVNCAFLPNTIKHEKHQHLLLQTINPEHHCNACNSYSEGMSYECKACNFQLAMECVVRAPRFLSHRYCKGHLIPLIYPPVPDHPQDFYCDICETEMHPKYWLYYCAKCDSTFHIRCIQHIDDYENSVRVGTITESYHKHPITYVRRKKSGRHVCSTCNLDINGHLILECQTCDFKICMPCHFDRR